MLRQFVKHVGGRSDRVGTEVEFQPRLLGSGYQSVGCCLVSCDVHISSWLLCLRLDAIDVCCRRVGVVAIVISCLHHLDVVLCDGRLFGKLLAKEVCNETEVAVEEPAHQAQREHVAALQYSLVVHTRVFQAVLHHLCQRALDDAVGVDAHFAQIVFCLEGSLLQVVRTEGVGVDDDCSLWLGIFVLSFQRCGVHCHEHVALVARRIYLAFADVHLESRHTGQRALRGADVCWIVGERADAVAHCSRNRRENVSGELHSVA